MEEVELYSVIGLRRVSRRQGWLREERQPHKCYEV